MNSKPETILRDVKKDKKPENVKHVHEVINETKTKKKKKKTMKDIFVVYFD